MIKRKEEERMLRWAYREREYDYNRVGGERESV